MKDKAIAPRPHLVPNITITRRQNALALFKAFAEKALAAGASPKGLEQAFAATHLFDEGLARLAWEARLQLDDARANQLVSEVCDQLLERIAANLPSIDRKGLLPMRRHRVHLSSDEASARAVGGRRGVPVVLVVDAARMERDGHKFFVSDNGIWLTDAVPSKYLSRMPDG